MAPSKKPRPKNKKLSCISDISPRSEDAYKSNQRKRKLSDMLGSEWSKGELKRFYQAYRKYGRNWIKVASVVRTKSAETVEAVYTLNKAYLSLPEATASVAGFVAMMTDHYCVLEGSSSDPETDDGAGTSRKLQKRARGKFQLGDTELLNSHLPVHSNSQPVGVTLDCFPSWTRKHSDGCRNGAVRKRMPRVPLSNAPHKNNVQKHFPTNRRGLIPRTYLTDDDIAHEIALALAKASPRGGSSHVSQTAKRRKENITLSQNVLRMTTESEVAGACVRGEMDDGGLQGVQQSIADNGDSARGIKYIRDSKGIDTIDVQRKGNKLSGKKSEAEIVYKQLVEDIKEASSATEQGQIMCNVIGKHESNVTTTKNARDSVKVQTEISKNGQFGEVVDEGPKFDALQALADLSLMMTSQNETEYKRGEVATSGGKGKRNHLIHAASEISDIDCAVFVSNEELNPSITTMDKSKQISLALVREEANSSAVSIQEATTAVDEGMKLVRNRKCLSHDDTPLDQGKLGKLSKKSSISADKRERENSAASVIEVPCPDQVQLRTRHSSKRKNYVPLKLNETDFCENFAEEQPSVSTTSLNGTEHDFKVKLSKCLSLYGLQRWCKFEWFYSSIDHPWFAKNEFMEYLDHVGFSQIPRLTRAEYGVIKSSLGKPRRLSSQFLTAERKKLNQYRESARNHFFKVCAGLRDGLPADVASPFAGCRVMAVHPVTHEICDGTVLAVDHSRCQVQFDRPELGVKFVKDIDCRNISIWENMSVPLTRQNSAVHKYFENFNDLKRNVREDQNLRGDKKHNPIEILETSGDPHVSPSMYPTSTLLKQASPLSNNLQCEIGLGEAVNSIQVESSQPSNLAQNQSKEADIQALSLLARTLDMKEAILSELKHMDDAALENKKNGGTLTVSLSFKKLYASLFLELTKVNEQVSSALLCLRKRNTYQGDIPAKWEKPMTSLDNHPNGLANYSDQAARDPSKLGSNMREVVKSARTKACTMALFTLKDGNVAMRIDDAVNYVNNQPSLHESCMPTVRPIADELASSETIHQANLTFNKASDRIEIQLLYELIGQCVSTLLMIKQCTKLQFPPADVARILDYALASLQPRCAQNAPIYAEIKKYIAIIRSQIMAVVPP